MQEIRLMALGGLDEDGKNMYIIEIDDDIFIVDAGLKYPNENEQLGIEYIIPDFSYLHAHKERIKAVFITHGHDDVMAAVGHLLKEIDIDVYATALTAKLLERNFKKLNLKKKINVIKRNSDLTIAGHHIHAFPVLQSIPDSIGLTFDTDYGPIVYTSEFVIDNSFNADAFSMDISYFAELGEKKVFALLAESVGATREGYTAPHHHIASSIEPYFEAAKDERLIISLYKQNLYRVMEVIDLCKKYKRKIMLYDDEQLRFLDYVEELGYYKTPRDLIVSHKEFNNDIKDIVCIVSGSGNEVFRLVNKIAIGEDRLIELRSDDTVIIASPIIPGTEKEASNMENDLYKAGVNVKRVNSKEVFSMHASIEDLKMMLYLLKPRYYIPIHGEYASLVANADIAQSMGYRPDKIIILDNGQFAYFVDGHLKSTRETISLKDTLIDGKDKLDVSGMVLKDRETLSTDGAIVVGVVLNFKTKEIIGGPDVQSRGVIYLKDADHIIQEIGNILIRTITEAVEEKRYENMQIRTEAKEKISRYILKETGKRPMVLPAIVEINIEA